MEKESMAIRLVSVCVCVCGVCVCVCMCLCVCVSVCVCVCDRCIMKYQSQIELAVITPPSRYCFICSSPINVTLILINTHTCTRYTRTRTHKHKHTLRNEFCIYTPNNTYTTYSIYEHTHVHSDCNTHTLSHTLSLPCFAKQWEVPTLNLSILN